MSKRIGYARVFTDDQNLEIQQNALKQAGCSDIYEEKVEGKSTDYPALDCCRGVLSAGDTFVVWRLDRLGRSLSDLVRIVNELEQAGIGFESITEKIETSSATGKQVFHVFAALAECERNIIRERTRVGLAAARVQGRRGGRKPALNDEQVQEIKELLHDPNIQLADVAKRYGVSRATLYKHIGAIQRTTDHLARSVFMTFSPSVADRPRPALQCPIMMATEALATQGGHEAHGAIFTRAEVVEFILDLAGYTEDKPLYEMRLLEPSFGSGNFLLPIIGRLLAAWRMVRKAGSALDDLGDAILAFELHRETFHSTHTAVVTLLEQEGIDAGVATELANRWLSQGDFLQAPLDDQFDFVVGNPPYVRQELIPAPLLAEYRSRYQTMYDRADLYVPFIERSLLALAKGGHLGFICADRWMKNRYGGPLRSLVADQFHLKIYVDMVDTPAFHSDVVAYPAITIISREPAGTTRIAHRPTIDHTTLAALAKELCGASLLREGGRVRELAQVTNGAEPWLLESADQMALIRRLEQCFPTLESAGCKVGIGVATGADKAFIGDFDSLDVEPDRKLPLVTTRDIMTGEVQWRGQGVINPFAEGGGLVDLGDYPRLHHYLEARQEVIAGRHCAQKSPANWYRTIDRITPALAKAPKLLIPDIKGEAHIVFEGGELYPHHNLYYVTSEVWDLRALQAVLLSAITRLFVATYSTKMRGGFLRFQAQYLRRIRIPNWVDVPEYLRVELAEAAKKRDLAACNRAVFRLYGLSEEEQSALGGSGE